ncbi:YgjV family protein [Natronincola ferrireducens]|uniref:Inner membrane protein n=1 Tax=Natronincola ferrireducens TaxID=393762 RepID=A0A1G8Z7Y6_9FIRM|nr:YgjV family protein [Natronincola ferrireducens]SDK11083.1 inner membrane protein [Natronincola ferrireducens]
MQITLVLLNFLALVVVVTIFKSNKKRKILILAVIALVVFSHQFVLVQKTTARLTATAYVTANYYHKGLKFEQLEWLGPYGAYGVRFKDENGDIMGVQVISKKVPIVVIYDSLDQGP